MKILALILTIASFLVAVGAMLSLSSFPSSYAFDEFEDFEKARTSAHEKVSAYSLPYFGSCAVLFTLAAFGGPRHRRKFIAGAAGGVLMFVWTLLLSGSVSFNEVGIAWIVAAVLFGVLSFLRSRHRK